MPHVVALHVHPVKGCRRTELMTATVGPHGFVGDREWQAIAPDGAFLSQRQHPLLARIRPELGPDGITLRCDGMDDLHVPRPPAADRDAQTYTGPVAVGDAGDAAAAWVAEVIGTPCRLVGMAPDFSRRVVIPAAAFADPASALAVAVERGTSTGVSLADGGSLPLINAASHRDLERDASEPFGVDRWRPNIVVDGVDAWAEDTWRRVRIGDAIIDVALPWPRCAVPQVDQETGARHNEPARVLKARRWCTEVDDVPDFLRALLVGAALFGVTAAATPIGVTISVGDEVQVLETGPPMVPFAPSTSSPA